MEDNLHTTDNHFQDGSLKTNSEGLPQTNLESQDPTKLLDQFRDQLMALKNELLTQTAKQPSSLDHSESQVKNYEQEISDLKEKIVLQEEKLKSNSENHTSEEVEDLKCRLDLALHDIKELKAENQSLNEKIKTQNSDAPPAKEGEFFDWETQKKQFMSHLENSDLETETVEEKQNRIKIEDLIETTDKELLKKEQEISDLKELLKDQSQNLEGVAVGAAAISEMIDQDKIIKNEREKLKALQEEWEEKLRKAEVELSLERAKISRQKTELEELAQHISQDNQTDSGKTNPEDQSSDKTVTRERRWLKRLGFKEEQE